MSHIRIAIDGPSGAGKSTLARAAAADLGFLYVDTGAIYRTVGLFVQENGLDAGDAAAVAAALPGLRLPQRRWLPPLPPLRLRRRRGVKR